jgi:hypothetical protein
MSAPPVRFALPLNLGTLILSGLRIDAFAATRL